MAVKYLIPYAEQKQQQIIQKMKKEKELGIKSKKTITKNELTKNEIHPLDLASEKRVLSWLNFMPLKRYHFELTKSEFCDGVAVSYGCGPVKMPSLCACNEIITVAHALHSPKGGYTHMRNNEFRDSFCKLAK